MNPLTAGDLADARYYAEKSGDTMIPRFVDELTRSRALLKRIEFSGWTYDQRDGLRTGRCPVCGGGPDTAMHAERQCELAALLGST